MTTSATQQGVKGLGAEAARCLMDFDAYLTRVRGLALGTRKMYCCWAGRFLATFCGTGAPDWSSLRGTDLATFVKKEAARLRRSGREVPAVALRAFLRYLCFSGLIPDGLQAALPQKPRWKLAGIPRHLPAADIERVVAASVMDGSVRGGWRNHAILLLLARTGLRAHEVAQLSLDDINWTEGTISVRSQKSRTERRLPLTNDVGASLARYLQYYRPPCTSRIIFLRVMPPFNPFTGSAAICRIARRALTRAGIHKTPAAAHLFRHAAATHMLNGGATFKEIADVLGHASIDSTAVYAKLDLASLSRVAMPWPGSTP